MHEQEIIDTILEKLDRWDCTVKAVSLVCGEGALRGRLEQDVAAGIRTADVIERSVSRIPCYSKLNTIKLETDGKTVAQIVDALAAL